MDRTLHKQQDSESAPQDEREQIAVPYIPPPPPDGSDQKKFRSPLVNAIIVALVILLGGFMLYNFVGHSLTQLAGDSVVQVSPTVTPSPTPQY